MRFDVLLTVIVTLQWIALVQSELLTIGMVGSIVSSVGYYVYNQYGCDIQECCTDNWIRPDLQKLNTLMSTKLFGQQIVYDTVISALHAHVTKENPAKALAMSFHGPGGTGKNYVAHMIVTSFCKMGFNSKYCHLFNGRNDFPLESKLNQYKEKLQETVSQSVERCGRSIFVFDEVDKMPKGLLSVLVPYLDYYSNVKGEFKKAIYIFLSNTGGNAVTKQLINFWMEGKDRNKLKLQHFENLITQGAFNEKGGFQYSDIIDNNVIDHYIPFLPLEEVHVKMCITEAFAARNVTDPTPMMMEEALSHIIFGPEPLNIYSNSGCKRLEQKVGVIVYQWKKAMKKN